MEFDFFYKEQSDQFAFYRIPKILITEEFFQELSIDAKLLYGLLLDRVSLSSNSGWFDEEGRVYVIYTIKSIMRDLHCGNKKAGRLMAELEKFGLIERKSRGLGRPWTIYVKNFSGPMLNGHLQACQNNTSGDVITTFQDRSEQHTNNTNINNTKNNDTNPILSGADVDNDEREAYYRYFYKQLEIEIMRQRYPMDGDVLSALVDILVDSVCSKRKTIRIAGDDKPINVVKSQFMKLNSSHVEYVMDSLKSNTTKIRNIKQYILATLYNAPLTMSSYYQAEVLHDFPQFAKKN